jgi:hypothetical protein
MSAMAAEERHRSLDALEELLYEQHGRPLEADHWGRILAVSESGETLLGDDLYDVLRRADEPFAHDTFIFKIGECAVGRWR